MTAEEIAFAWSNSVAELAADALVDAKLLAKIDFDKACKIIAKEGNIRLVMGDRPDAKNFRYKSK